MDSFPKIEIMPVVDRMVDVGLWVGRLLTKHIQHLTPSEHFSKPVQRYDVFDLDSNRWDSEGNYHDEGL